MVTRAKRQERRQGRHPNIVYCRRCKGTAHVDEAEIGCLCGAGWETKEGQPVRLDGTPIEAFE